jgi:hypothetical protein
MARRKELPDVAVQKAKYLEGFAFDCTLTAGCKAANVHFHTVYQWREMDDDFVMRENELRVELADRLEAEAIRRAFVGWDRPIYQRGELVGYERVYDGSLLKMLLAAARPEKFRENINVSGQVEQIVRQVAGFDASEVL